MLGVGDALASVVGTHLGSHRWPGSRKTVEGSAAALLSMMAALWAADCYLRPHESAAAGPGPWAALLVVTAAACALEAVTDQIDNLFLPLYYLAALLAVASLTR